MEAQAYPKREPSVSRKKVQSVMRELWNGCDTRARLADRLQMNKMTVSRVVGLLLLADVLSEREERDREGRSVKRLRMKEPRCFLILKLFEEDPEAILVDGSGAELGRISFLGDDPMEETDLLNSHVGRALSMLRLLGRVEEVDGVAMLLRRENGYLSEISEKRGYEIFYGGEERIPEIVRILNERLMERILSEKKQKSIDKN